MDQPSRTGLRCFLAVLAALITAPIAIVLSRHPTMPSDWNLPNELSTLSGFEAFATRTGDLLVDAVWTMSHH